MPRINEVPEHTLPEIQRLNVAKHNLEAIRAANAHFFETLRQHVEEYNSARAAAEKVVKAGKVSCGDFELYQQATKIDGQALHDAIGRDAFLRIGGSVATEVTYKIDKKRLEQAVAKKEIPKEVAEEVTTQEARYHAPKEIVLW